MRLKYLVISDTHVGEPNSLLSFPRGLQELWHSLRTKLGQDNSDPLNTPLEVDELILLGDIPDRTLSSTSEIQTQTGALIRTLLSAITTRRIVYVIGNHDHTLWTNYKAGSQNPGKDVWAIEKPSGINIIDSLERQQELKAEELLSIFFEYPYGSSWNEIVKGFKGDNPFQFVLANPLYAGTFKDRMYVFTHGAYIRSDVCLPQIAKDVFAKTPIADLVDLEIEPGEDVRGAKNLSDYERRVYRFVETLWPGARNNPLTKADAVWILRRQLRIGMDEPRPRPEETELIPWDELRDPKYSDRIKDLCRSSTFSSEIGFDKRSNLNRLQDFALKHIINYIDDNPTKLRETKGLTFVYGDTHQGGFAEVILDLKRNKMVAPESVLSGDGLNMRIVNTGGWLVEYPKRHPACHVFAVDYSGKEYILDISYKEIKIGEDLLLDLAEMQVGHRLSRVDSVGAMARNLKDFVNSIFS